MVRRVLAMIPVLVIVLLISFVLIRMIPGDPVLLILGPESLPEQAAELRAELGLDRSIPMQLLIHSKRVLSGDFGSSIMYREPVTSLILQRAETSCLVAVMAMVVVLLIGLPAGIIAAVKAGTWIDQVFLFFAMLGISIPAFWLGLLMINLFAVQLRWFPSSGFRSILATGDLANLRYLILPALTLGYRDSALVARMTRSCLLESLREDYIATARSKGLAESMVVLRHALRNAAIPVFSVFTMTFASMVAGTVVTETVFALPGVGRLLMEAINGRDYPLLQGLLVVFASIYLIMNLLTDVTYGVLDPRIRYD
jgi:peptide/nickel transport system permease protein